MKAIKKTIAVLIVLIAVFTFGLTAYGAPPECPNESPPCSGFLDIDLGCSGTTSSIWANRDCDTTGCTYDTTKSWDITGCDLSCGWAETHINEHNCKDVHDAGCPIGTYYYHN